MFKTEINFISDLNINKLQVLGDRFTLDDLRSSKIHPAILHYIYASIDKEIFRDRKKIESNSVFNYRTDRINNYFLMISEEIKRTQHFDFEFLKPLVQNAIVFNINYLTNPKKTLVKLVFGDIEVKKSEEIILGINHAYYYRYLKKILLTYLEKKKILSMRKDEFRELLDRVDNISKETHLDDTIITAVNSMTNFFDQNSKLSEKLPLKAIQLFLEEKELTEFSTKLDSNFIAESSTLFLSSDIINVLKSVTPEKEITIEESQKIEDQLEIDNSPNQNVDLKNEKIESINNSGSKSVDHDEIFEATNDEIDIPNNEILSNDDIVAEVDLSKNIIQHDVDLENDFEEVESKDETQEDNSNKNSEKKDENELDELDSEKKKPDTIKILNNLIDTNPLFESLLKEVKPFENFEEQIDLIKNLKNRSDELNYQIDLSTLSETFSLPEQDENVNNNQDFIDYNVEPNESKNLSEDILENESLEISDTIDDTVRNLETEEEYLSVNETLENVENEELIIESNENLVENSLEEIDEDMDEVTEVFKDLTFLDNDDEGEPQETEINSFENLENKTDKEFQNINNSTPESDFFQSLLNRDMSKIIESVFDYDMEEYYSIVDTISQSTSESEALSALDQYCCSNHIELETEEVGLFKSLISKYFAKTYS